MATYERALLTMTDEDEDRKTMFIDLWRGRHWPASPIMSEGWTSMQKSLVGSIAMASIIWKTCDPFKTFVYV